MERTRVTGAILMAVMTLQALGFVIGVTRRSYTALALPLSLLMAAISLLGFWVGWTLLAAENDLAGLEFAAEPIDES